MHYGRDKIITDVTLKLALSDQLTQLNVFKLFNIVKCILDLKQNNFKIPFKSCYTN